MSGALRVEASFSSSDVSWKCTNVFFTSYDVGAHDGEVNPGGGATGGTLDGDGVNEHEEHRDVQPEPFAPLLVFAWLAEPTEL